MVMCGVWTLLLSLLIILHTGVFGQLSGSRQEQGDAGDVWAAYAAPAAGLHAADRSVVRLHQTLLLFVDLLLAVRMAML